ncbi:TPA: hypothetical protein DIC20_02580 [Candidatus Dependentiae bacterium]|nr:MAG: ATPase component of ABC transporter [candidate division TM6 bacterium GW2011_GWF2_36_131]KKQ03388.1 MAG: ATPase component of ABC transporter [candidate division TM6 bacterium GW2011_GWE2_36_25]KKQ18931.1 MAG: ATPase component of ABC transporter [candidate division TM6 bacterium GW2011_GWA2_36_9]HBR70832.1 hypothetical protein [Candidatus Dependentiae bacterium]HCU00565.1 hypothetical protein [Candidatus Dependentiae bacterium]
MIHIKDLNLTFKDQVIFNDVSLTLKDNDKIGIVGRNGSGKTTLLRIIAGMQQADLGIIQKPSSFKIGYMPQEFTLTSSKNVLDETLNAIKDLDQTERPLAEVAAKKILLGLGFKQDQLIQPVATLSTGWKMRVVLAQLLLQKADFYLFDEPTNHLDLLAQEWFFNFLKNAPFGFALVSHDRYYLDHLCSSIIELEGGNCTRYNGNYTSYLKQKEERAAIEQATYENQQKEIKRKQQTIDRFRAKATKAKMVKKIEKELAKMDIISIAPQPSTVHFSFPETRESGKTVLHVEHLSFSFSNKPILKDAAFTLLRHEKTAIVAPNGTGKTTLLNLIVGKYKQQAGTITFGHNVKIAYFEQDQLETFHPEKTIFETVQERTNATDLTIRTMLGSFLFTQDLITKKIKVLSGGEKNRVNMVCTLLQNANFLLLDEPTNHLDIYSKEILLQALKEYQGTILFVSHDHNFVNNLSTSILELSDGKIAHYHGNYESYLEQKRAFAVETTQTKIEPKKIEKSEHNVDYESRKQLSRLTSKIERLEKQVVELNNKMSNIEHNTTQFNKLFSELQQKHQELEEALQEWEHLLS